MNYFIYLFLSFFLLFGNRNIRASNWYVNNGSTGGNTGASWTNAWESFADINWASISPGDTIFISGGSTSKTYNETLTIGASGSSGNNIVIIASSEASHNGVVIIDGQETRDFGISMGGYDYITISGNNQGHGGNARPDSIDCGIKITDTNGAGINNTGATGVIVEYCYIYYVGRDAGSDIYKTGIRLNAPANCIVRYNFIYDCYNDGVYVPNPGEAGLGWASSCTVHHNTIQEVTGDGVKCHGGMDIYDNLISGCWYHARNNEGDPEHPDGIQSLGSGYDRIYNNIIYDIHIQGIFISPLNRNYRYGRIYNNVIRQTSAQSALNQVAICLTPETGGSYWMHDVLVANNTIVDVNGWGVRVQDYGDQTVDSIFIYNNIWHNSNRGAAQAIENEFQDTSQVRISNNNLSAGDNGGDGVRWNESNYTYANFVSSILGGDNYDNNNSAVWFTSYSELGTSNDFTLNVSDTAAIGLGLSLASYFTTDANGVTRSGSWDIGAYELYTGVAGSPVRPIGLKIVK